MMKLYKRTIQIATTNHSLNDLQFIYSINLPIFDFTN